VAGAVSIAAQRCKTRMMELLLGRWQGRTLGLSGDPEVLLLF